MNVNATFELQFQQLHLITSPLKKTLINDQKNHATLHVC